MRTPRTTAALLVLLGGCDALWGVTVHRPRKYSGDPAQPRPYIVIPKDARLIGPTVVVEVRGHNPTDKPTEVGAECKWFYGTEVGFTRSKRWTIPAKRSRTVSWAHIGKSGLTAQCRPVRSLAFDPPGKPTSPGASPQRRQRRAAGWGAVRIPRPRDRQVKRQK